VTGAATAVCFITLEANIKRKHQLALGLRYAMSFPAPEPGKELSSFVQAVDVRAYCLHMEAVAHNRRWLAEHLVRHGRSDEAQAMWLAAGDADRQLSLTAGALVAHDPDVEAA
jgi:hypothetical protein